MKKLLAAMGIGVLLVGLLAGCMYVPEDNAVSVKYFGDVNESSSMFHMDGNISVGGGIPDQEVLEDVHVCLYDDERSVIDAHRVGDLNARSDRVQVTIAAEQRPEYVVFESPDFWKDDVSVRALRLDSDGQYEHYTVHTYADRFGDEGAGEEEAVNDEYKSCGDA